jgi:hypothetical protein
MILIMPAKKRVLKKAAKANEKKHRVIKVFCTEAK